MPASYASISTAAAGDNVIVAAPGAQLIVRVFNYVLVAAGAVTVQWKSDVGGGATALTGVMTLATPFILQPGEAQFGHFVTATNKALNLSLGGAVQVSGYVVYEITNSLL